MAEREELRMKKEQKEERKLLRQQKVEEKQAAKLHDRETAKRSIAPGQFARFHAEFLGVGEKHIS